LFQLAPSNAPAQKRAGPKKERDEYASPPHTPIPLSVADFKRARAIQALLSAPLTTSPALPTRAATSHPSLG